MRITVDNRGPEAAPIHVLPQLWFRNTWCWKPDRRKPVAGVCRQRPRYRPSTRQLGTYYPVRRRQAAELPVLRQRDQRAQACGTTDASRLLQGRVPRVRRQRSGRRRQSRAHRHQSRRLVLVLTFPPAAAHGVQLRLTERPLRRRRSPISTRCSTHASREADEFYASLQQRHCRAPTRAPCSARHSPA